MNKLKVYLVDDNIYWCDYSREEAYTNYRAFCLEESGFYEPPIEEYPKELDSKMLENFFILSFGGEYISMKDAVKEAKSPGLIYCGDFEE